MAEVSCATIMRVLGDETRLGVVKQLLHTPKQVNELNQAIPVSQSLLSHHLKILRDAGLVIAKRAGKAVLYDISPKFRLPSGINLGCCQLEFDSTEQEGRNAI
ncbi:MAG: metalloregulator ArsR/SmtB family transcription factor [Gammaproteobacteria bacterium]|nr:metalloregulator ArsR/SmtB family transcription factor [Gammaproteobacteria bacterium]MDH5802888.1 metalloregulator ArsR/SmtB family transcription factor [Gammaproteobacteria bacterium]